MRRNTVRPVLAALVVVALSSAGCVARVGETQTLSEDVALEGAESVVARLESRSAEIDVAGGADDLLEAEFRFNVEQLEPVVEYDVSGSTGTLEVRESRTGSIFSLGDVINEWELRLGADAPIDLFVGSSSGHVELDLEDVDVEALEIDTSSGDAWIGVDGDHPSLTSVKADTSSGEVIARLKGSYERLSEVRVGTSSGDVEVDFAGTFQESIDVNVDTSSGDVIIVIPGDASARVTVETSSGDVSADGFVLRGDEYSLDGPSAGPTFEIEVDTSSGDVTLMIEQESA